MAKTKKVYRDAKSGEFTTKKNVEKNPAKATTEMRPIGPQKKKKKWFFRRNHPVLVAVGHLLISIIY